MFLKFFLCCIENQVINRSTGAFFNLIFKINTNLLKTRKKTKNVKKLISAREFFFMNEFFMNEFLK